MEEREQNQGQSVEELLFRCPVCGFHYRGRETAEKCEEWCREHQSCNLEITAKAVENQPKRKSDEDRS